MQLVQTIKMDTFLAARLLAAFVSAGPSTPSPFAGTASAESATPCTKAVFMSSVDKSKNKKKLEATKWWAAKRHNRIHNSYNVQ